MATVNWIGKSGYWGNAANWSGDALPTYTSAVYINTASFFTITHASGSDSIASLAVGNDAFVLSGGTLSIGTKANFANGLTETGGVLSGSATVTLHGASNFSGGEIAGSTVLTNTGNLAINNIWSLGGSAELSNSGTVDQNGVILLGDSASSTASIRNNAGATILMLPGSYIENGTGSSDYTQFTNAGTVKSYNATSTYRANGIGVDITNTGTISVVTGELILSGQSNSFAGLLTTTGTLEVGFGAYSSFSGMLSGTGEMLFGSGSVNVLRTGAAINVANVVIDFGLLAVDTSITSASTWSESGGTIELGGSTLTLTGPVDLTAGTVDGSGVLLNSGTMALQGLYLGGSATITNSGTILVSSNATAMSVTETGMHASGVSSPQARSLPATLLNRAGGVLALTDDVGIDAGAGSLQGSLTLINSGIFTKTGGTGTSGIYVDVTDTGTVSVLTGALVFEGSLNSFSGQLSSIGTLAFENGSNTIAGTITGSGSVLFGVGSTDILEAGTKLSVAAVTIDDAIVTADANLSSAGTWTIENTGALSLANKNLILSGPVTVAGGTIDGTGVVQNSGTMVLDSLILTGAATLSNIGTVLAYGAFLELGTPTGSTAKILNQKGGVFDLTDDATDINDAATFNSVGFINAGLFTKSSGTGNTYVDFDMTNTGTISAAIGNLVFEGQTNSLGGVLTTLGTIELRGQTSTISGTVSGRGTVEFDFFGTDTIAAGSAINVANVLVRNAQVTVDTALTSDSTWTIESGTLDLGGANLTLTGSLIASGGGSSIPGGAGTIAGNGILTTGGAAELDGLNLIGSTTLENTGTITDFGDIFLATGTASSAGLVNEAGGVFIYLGENAAITGAGIFTNDGTLEFAGGSGGQTLGGSAAVSNAGTIVENGSTIIIGDSSTPNSIVEPPGGAEPPGVPRRFADPPCGIANQLGAVYDITDNSGIAKGNTTGLPEFLNAGLLEKTGGTGVSVIGIDVIDTGTITGAVGTLEFAGASNSFTGTINGAGTIAFASGVSVLKSGAVVTVAHLSVATGKTSLGESLTYAGGFAESAGEVALNGDTLSLTGTAAFSGGIIGGTGSLVTSKSVTLAALIVEGSALWTNRGTVTETGNLTLGAYNGGPGSLTNAAGGIFDITKNGGIGIGASTTDALTNAGTIEKTGGVGVSTIAPSTSNTGKIDVTSGTLNLAGAITGTGAETIGAAGTLQFDNSVAATQSISFAGTTGGDLVLDDPSGTTLSFSGSVTGFSGSDEIDLATFNIQKGPSLSWAQAGAEGTLTVTDGSDIAKILLFGQYMNAGFHFSNDGGFGIAITYQKPPTSISIGSPHH